MKYMKYLYSDKAKILQQQFSSVFTKEPKGSIPRLDERTNTSIEHLQVTEEQVKSEINRLNINKCCGPDHIHPRLLKELVNYLSKPIALLINKSINEGMVPKDWKKAIVSPIYKKGSKHLAENYRPISLTSIICKLMETLIKKVIMKHLEDHNLLSTKQFGFINGKSTTLQLLVYLEKCIETIANGGVVDSIYMDFAKAFDKVPHRRLIGKLKSYGIKGEICKWIEEFSTNNHK